MMLNQKQAFVFLVVIFGVSKSKDVKLGNNVTSGFTLSTDPRVFIFTDVDVPEGIITAISFYSTGVNLALKFQIWRQINATEYLLAAQIRYVTSSIGVQQIDLVNNKQVFTINNLHNARLGFSMESRDCPISYNVFNIHEGALLTSRLIDQSIRGSLVVGDDYAFSGNLMDKTFSVQWLISTGEVHCKKYNGGCDHMCLPGQGQVTCSCHHGYQLASDGRNCLDIDECLTSESCPSATYCINTNGSHVCVLVEKTGRTNNRAPTAQGSNFLLHSPDVSLGIIIWLSIVTVITMVMALFQLRKHIYHCCHRLVPMTTRTTSQMNIVEGYEQSDNVYNIDMANCGEIKC